MIDLVPSCDKTIAVYEKLRAAPAIVRPNYGQDGAYAKGVTILTNLKMAWQVKVSRIDAVDRKDCEVGQVDMTDSGAVAVSQVNVSLDPWSTVSLDSS